MSYDVFYESEWGTVRYNETDQYIYHTFHKPVSGAPFQEMMNAGLDKLVNTGATKWLSDDRNNSKFVPEDIEFAVQDWGPRASDAGWKYWALVVPESIAGRASMQDIVNAFFKMDVQVAIFTDVEEAQRWLVSR